MKNDIFDYYVLHKISPVHQNIKDFSLHCERRQKLYRQCGVPRLAFRNADMLEVGPGSGYNSLSFFQMSTPGGHLDLVEPNPKGEEDMEKLFFTYGIGKERYHIFPVGIEEFCSEKQYDIVIAEGFLPELDNQEVIAKKLAALVKPGGLIVITCEDEVGKFIEIIKRFISQILVKNIDNHDEKVDFLTHFFEPQLRNLRGMSRSVKDWVEDQMLCPSFINGHELSLASAIQMFAKEFRICGSSPSMFTDYSWYKDVWHDHEAECTEQYQMKRLSLLMSGMLECICSTEVSSKVVEIIRKIRKLTNEYERSYDENIIENVQENLSQVRTFLTKIDLHVSNVVEEMQRAIHDVQCGEINLEKYAQFFSAFSRSQQYIAFEKIMKTPEQTCKK